MLEVTERAHVCDLCTPPKTFATSAHADTHRRWQHPNPLDIMGEECAPPPMPVFPTWAARVAMLDSRPGTWRRWPYRHKSSAYHGARTVADRVLFGHLGDQTAKYLFQAHHLDGRWWVYGIRLTGELDPTTKRSTSH